MKSIISVILVILLNASLSGQASVDNLPRSREGTLIESTSPTEVMVKARGIGYWEKGMSKKGDREKYLLRDAERDARKAAVYFVLFGGTDPLLSSEAGRSLFVTFQDEFFTDDNIHRYIAWEAPDLMSRIKKDIERKKKYELNIEKAFKINKQALIDDLTLKGILPTREDIVEALGMPFVMVIPAAKMGESPLELMGTDPQLSHAAKVIESYLTALQYDVLVPEQQQDLSALTAAQQAVEGIEEDFSYQLALSIGSDVYITFEVNIDDDKFNTKKAVASVRAYETTTARLLGTETGYSPSSNASELALIENAVNDAIDKVLSRILDYWKNDLTQGIQYKLIVSIIPGFDEDQVEEITFLFNDLLTELTKKGKFKENILTNKTLDYLIWVDPEEYGKSTTLYRWLKSSFEDEFGMAKLMRININRKLLQLKIEM